MSDDMTEDQNLDEINRDNKSPLDGDDTEVTNANFKWYVIRIATGKENKFKDLLVERIKREDKHSFFGEILIPTEEVVELRAGQKRKVKRKYFPGYVLIQMDMGDESWQLVRSIPGSLGFIGGKGNHPLPISEAEAQKILKRTIEKPEEVKQTTVFSPGELIRVTDGAFADFNGVVEEVNTEKSRLVVSVLIFGRSTPVELEFSQVEKGT
ncbi:MAG: transcription termination/antitermination protein NusG [Pseudomonadota bacterium]|nr:transcription termination/antitermination protein NusG [Pseudomonadota bacterium]